MIGIPSVIGSIVVVLFLLGFVGMILGTAIAAWRKHASEERDPLRERNRGLAAAILRFVVVGGIFALIYGVLDIVVSKLTGDLGLAANSAEVGQLQSYMSSGWLFLPALIVFLLSARLLARAVFESRGGV
jgi:formate-dependent nitrite reductase membrane component NrfD